MLYDMQNKPALAGRPGKSGVRFRLILKRLLRVTIQLVIAMASCAHPARLPAKLVPPC